MTDLILFSGVNLIFLTIGYIMGHNATREKLVKKLNEIISVKQRVEGGGVKPLSPQELSKVRGREILDKYL